MTSARGPVHLAIKARIVVLALGMPVKLGPTNDLPYIRLDGVRERESNPNKDQQGSELEARVSAFSLSDRQASEAITAIINDFTADQTPLNPEGIGISRVELDDARPIDSPDTSRTVYGHTAAFIIYAYPDS